PVLAPQAADRARADQPHEQREERPVRHPPRRDVVDPRGVVELPAGRQVELARDPLKIVVPADSGKPRRRALDAAVRLELEVALAQLDAHPGPVAETGQELLAAVDRRAPEDGRRRHLQPPAATRRAAELILAGEPA